MLKCSFNRKSTEADPVKNKQQFRISVAERMLDLFWFFLSATILLFVLKWVFFFSLLLVQALGFSKAPKDNFRLEQMLYEVVFLIYFLSFLVVFSIK